MNRTTVYFALAGALVLTAVMAGLPKRAAQPPSVQAPLHVPIQAPAPPVPGSLTMSGLLSHPYVMRGMSDLHATLQISAVERNGQRAPVNFALVIDRSGSMAGQKLAQAKRAAIHLVDLLDENDRLAIVHYGNDVRVFSAAMCTAQTRERMKQYLAGIQESGGTNIGAGLAEGQAQLTGSDGSFRVNRLLLLSDGQPTVGVTSVAGLIKIVDGIRKNGSSVTSMGVGADFNEDLMQRLSDVGGGAYGFISDASSTARLFEKDLKQAGTLVAQGATVRFTVPDGVTLEAVYGRPMTIEGRVVTVTLPDFAAGQVEKLVMRFAVTAGRGDNGQFEVGQFELAYRDVLAERDANASTRLMASFAPSQHVVEANRNHIAYLDATRARTAVNYEKAAKAIDRGDFDSANRAVAENGAVLKDAAAVIGADAVATEREEQAAFYGLSSAAAKAPAESQRTAVKGLKVKALRNSGRGAESVY